MDSFETCEIVVPDASRPIIKAAAAPAAAAVPVSTKQPTATAASDCGSGLARPQIAERETIFVSFLRGNLVLSENFPREKKTLC